jgi:hypothetical protein
MAGTLCLSGAMFYKAGKNVSADIKNETFAVAMINQAESFINLISRTNWIDNYAGLNIDNKLILEEACSNLAAIYAIQYDMSGYTSRMEAEDMINILRDRAMQCIGLLMDNSNIKFITG